MIVEHAMLPGGEGPIASGGNDLMKLSAAQPGQVCRHVENGSHYRYERPERGRVRIYPLELFPNGRLIAKPTPTIVNPDLDVLLIGEWRDGMQVEGKPDHTRMFYERQLAEKLVELVGLEAGFLELPSSGIGKQSRGSWSNKLKNCRQRIVTLGMGLEELQESEVAVVAAVALKPAFRRSDLIQLPSGLPGRIEKIRGLNAEVMTVFCNEKIVANLPTEVLRPWSHARLATI